MSQIKVDQEGLHTIASSIRASKGDLNSANIQITKDSQTTISGNKNASEAIDKISKVVKEINSAIEKYAGNLDNYADAMKETDETSYN